MTYFDAGYIVKCYVNEAGSDEVRRLAGERDRIACSEFGRMELHSALHRKLREESLSREQLDVILRQLDLDESERLWTWLPLSERLMSDVASLYRALPPGVWLRTGDAIHLVSARMHSFDEIWSGDARLVAAAPHLGLAGRSAG
jgi:uncharacterized protein